MPNKKSAAKALRQSEKKAAKNRNVKGSLEYQRRMLRKALAAKELKEAQELSRKIMKGVDKAVQNGVVKKNTGSRIKSRMALALNRLTAESK